MKPWIAFCFSTIWTLNGGLMIINFGRQKDPFLLVLAAIYAVIAGLYFAIGWFQRKGKS